MVAAALRLSQCFMRSSRQFSTTGSPSAKSTIKRVMHQHQNVPPYPYGIARWYKKSNLGLYGGLMLRTGHNVSSETETKTRRKWHPNIVRKKIYSEALGRMIRVKVSTRVLRTIDKVGGLDEYLLGDKPARIKELGMFGWLLRWRIMRTRTVRDRFKRERERLGLHKQGPGVAEQKQAYIGIQGEPVTEEELGRQIKQFDAELDEHQATEAAEEAAERAAEGAATQRLAESNFAADELAPAPSAAEKPNLTSLKDGVAKADTERPT